MRPRSGLGAVALAATVALASAAAAIADHGIVGHTTLEQRIVADTSAGYRQLSLDPTGAPHVVREEGIGVARDGRESRRTSLAYFAQLSDFQLADEESPLRVEFLDPLGDPVSSAFRPWEAMEPHVDDAMIRQVNALAPASPVADGEGSRRPMDFSIDTGDAADNQQLNETRWVQQLYDGGEIDPNSGVDPADHESPLCPASGVPGAAEAAGYTGVQDYDDYDRTQVSPAGYFYDPDEPAASPVFDGFPAYTGLMDRAQTSFEAAGLDVPSYIAFGNHDALVQGSIGGNTVFEQVALGCIKPLTPELPGNKSIFTGFSVQDVLDLREQQPEKTFLVPPDPGRRLVSKQEYKQVFKDGAEDDEHGHGFDLIDPAEEAASNNNAGYYAFSPTPGVRMIALDTVSEGGSVASASSGNIDHPQYQWLESTLQAARQAKELVVLYSHHAPDSLTANTSDEFPGPCGAVDEHGHHLGCDIDPRPSTPIHLKDDMIALLHRYPNVIAWAAGHSHVNKVQAFSRPGGGGFWVLRVAAEADWPQQARLLELFDNHDGTISIFGTLIDHAAPAPAPAAGDASGFDPTELASAARTLAYNDPQSGARCAPTPCGEGAPADRNVELLVADPRIDPPATTPVLDQPADQPTTKRKCKKKKKKGKRKRGKRKRKKCR